MAALSRKNGPAARARPLLSSAAEGPPMSSAISLNASQFLNAFRRVGGGRMAAGARAALGTRETHHLVAKAVEVAVQARAAIARAVVAGPAEVSETVTEGTVAALRGRAFSSITGAFSTLSATREINEQTSTVRASGVMLALGSGPILP